MQSNDTLSGPGGIETSSRLVVRVATQVWTAASSTGTHADALSDGAPLYIRPAEAEIKYPDGVPGALRKR